MSKNFNTSISRKAPLIQLKHTEPKTTTFGYVDDLKNMNRTMRRAVEKQMRSKKK